MVALPCKEEMVVPALMFRPDDGWRVYSYNTHAEAAMEGLAGAPDGMYRLIGGWVAGLDMVCVERSRGQWHPCEVWVERERDVLAVVAGGRVCVLSPEWLSPCGREVWDAMPGACSVPFQPRYILAETFASPARAVAVPEAPRSWAWRLGRLVGRLWRGLDVVVVFNLLMLLIWVVLTVLEAFKK